MKQPTALRLAAALNSESESVSSGVKYSTARQSAKELVRLHEANQAMVDALKMSLEICDGCSRGFLSKVQDKARSAIAKGEKA